MWLLRGLQTAAPGLRYRSDVGQQRHRPRRVSAPGLDLLSAEGDAQHRGEGPAERTPARRQLPAPGRLRAAGRQTRHSHALQQRPLHRSASTYHCGQLIFNKFFE